MIDAKGNVLVCIVKWEDRASRGRVSQLLQIGLPRMMTSQEMLERTGDPAGGTRHYEKAPGRAR